MNRIFTATALLLVSFLAVFAGQHVAVVDAHGHHVDSRHVAVDAELSGRICRRGVAALAVDEHRA